MKIPISEKFALTMEEAVEYFNIGEKKLRDITNSDDCPYVLWVGNKRLIKRKLMESYLTNLYSV